MVTHDDFQRVNQRKSRGFFSSTPTTRIGSPRIFKLFPNSGLWLGEVFVLDVQKTEHRRTNAERSTIVRQE
jgi:hypothetical protein